MRRGAPSAPGLLLVDKPAGPTSHDVVQTARRALGTRRIGHTGTLDPFATGLLLLCVGTATRLAEYFHPLPKRYLATLRLGVRTDTDDAMGAPLATSERWTAVTAPGLDSALSGFLGKIDQTPPQFSARRVDGRRAYAIARAGETVVLTPRRAHIHELSVIRFDPPEVVLRCVVSTGTYIRALARDLGDVLKCGAHLTALRRTSIGPFEVECASAPEEWRQSACVPEGALHSPARALDWLPSRALTEAEAERVRRGGDVPARRVVPPNVTVEELASWGGGGPPVRLLRQGRLLAMAEWEGGMLFPRKVFAE